jgi:hypothetical protein
MSTQVAVFIRGGVVQSVYSNKTDVEVEVFDMDDLKEFHDFKQREEELEKYLKSKNRVY